MITRKFTPGTEWLYIKIYSSKYYIDHILTHEISSIIKKLEKDKIISKFFFIRYEDPHYHLRLRFLTSELKNLSLILEMLCIKLKKYIKNEIVWKIQIDTYEREIERYNKYLINITETLFYIDSKYVIEALKKISEDEKENYKWMLAIKSIDSYLNLFETDISKKLLIIKSMSNSFKLEFSFNDNNSKILNNMYREKRHIFEDILFNSEKSEDALFIHLSKIIKKRDKELLPVVFEIKNICKNKKLNYINYLGSYIHMNINRIIPSKNRIHELLLYDFIKRCYESEIARKNINYEKN